MTVFPVVCTHAVHEKFRTELELYFFSIAAPSPQECSRGERENE